LKKTKEATDSAALAIYLKQKNKNKIPHCWYTSIGYLSIPTGRYFIFVFLLDI
jgi:hypothetical protein